MTSISFDDDAQSTLVLVANEIPDGYTVALLGNGQDVPNTPDPVPGVDVAFQLASADGVHYRELDPETTNAVGPVLTRSWDDIARIHVY